MKLITAALRQLTPGQRKRVAIELAELDAQPASSVLIEGRFACGATCPHCKSMLVIRNGHAYGLQRYRWRECCKTFSALTGSPLNRLHKRDKWLDQTHALQDPAGDCPWLGNSPQDRTRAGGIAFWRHPRPSTQTLTGIAEADETMFLLSFKVSGVVWIARHESAAGKPISAASRTNRCQDCCSRLIMLMKQESKGVREIGRFLNRSLCTISRELDRDWVF